MDVISKLLTHLTEGSNVHKAINHIQDAIPHTHIPYTAILQTKPCKIIYKTLEKQIIALLSGCTLMEKKTTLDLQALLAFHAMARIRTLL